MSKTRGLTGRVRTAELMDKLLQMRNIFPKLVYY